MAVSNADIDETTHMSCFLQNDKTRTIPYTIHDVDWTLRDVQEFAKSLLRNWQDSYKLKKSAFKRAKHNDHVTAGRRKARQHDVHTIN